MSRRTDLAGCLLLGALAALPFLIPGCDDDAPEGALVAVADHPECDG